MSKYGRLWQKASDIRDELRRLQPSIDTTTLASAIRTAGKEERIKSLVSEWAHLERLMADCED